MSDINVNWGAAPVPQDYTAAALEGAQAGQAQRGISALQGIDLSDPDSVNRALQGSVAAGAFEQASALLGLNMARFKNQAFVNSYNSNPFGSSAVADPNAAPQPQSAAPDSPSAGAPADGQQPTPDQIQHMTSVMQFGKQSADSLLGIEDPVLRKAQADVIATKAQQMGVDPAFAQNALGDLSDAHLQSLSDNYGQWLQHPTFGGQGAPDGSPQPSLHQTTQSFVQAPNRLQDPRVLNWLAQRGMLGIDDKNMIEALKAGQGYTGTVAPGDQVEYAGQPTDRAPYAPITLSPGQVPRDVNSGADIGSPTLFPKTFEQVAPGSTAAVFNQNTGQTNQAVEGGTPAAAGPGSGGSVKYNNPAAVKALPTGKWPGQTGVTSDGVAIFDDPSDGYAAADSNLLSYATSHGVNTVAGIVNRWTPAGVDGNPSTAPRIATISHALGVDPNAPLDLKGNPILRHQLLAQLIPGEGMVQSAAPTGAIAPGQPIGGKTLAPPTTVPGAPGLRQTDFTGKVGEPLTGSYVDPQSARGSLLGNPQIEAAQTGVATWNAMKANAETMTGPAALGMLESLARTYTGGIARPTTIQNTLSMFSIPQQAVGQFESALQGKGPLTPQMRQQLLDSAYNFVSSHYDLANGIVQGQKGAVAHTGGDPAILNDVLPPKPPPYYVAGGPGPSPTARTPGHIIETAKGQMMWNAATGKWTPVHG